MCATNLRRGLWFASELLRITHHLAKKEIRAIPYKGPVLAQSAYGDLALRHFSDLDLLISPRDFDQAKNALSLLWIFGKLLTPIAYSRIGIARSLTQPFQLENLASLKVRNAEIS